MKIKVVMMMMAMSSMAMGAQAQSQLKSGIDLTDLNQQVRPGEDFYDYACGGWMQKNPLPAAYSRYGSFDRLAEDNNKRINGILKELQEKTYPQGSVEQKLSDLYKLAMDSARREKDGVAPVMGFIQKMEAAKTVAQLFAIQLEMMPYGDAEFFSAYMGAGTARPWSQEEITHLQAYVNRGYALFRKRVADGRKMNVEEVEKIAQGRVWLGTDAKKIKLIDGFGSLDDAIVKAAQLAKISDYQTTEYPMQTDWMEQLLAQVSENSGNYLDEQLKLTLGNLYQPFVMIRNMKEKEPVQAALPFFLNIN